MIIVLKRDATQADADEILADIQRLGLTPLHMPGVERVVLGALGDERVLSELNLASHPAVESVKPILTPYKLVGRELHPHDSIVNIGGTPVGGRGIVVVAGLSGIGSADAWPSTAESVQKAGARLLVAEVTRNRTCPYTQHHGAADGISFLKSVRPKCQMPLVAEAPGIAELDKLEPLVNAFQVPGDRMGDYSLLRELGRRRKPVILTRGVAATIDEFLMSAEVILAGGNPDVVMCETGIRTFETATPRTLDLSAVPYIKARSHLPVLVDPIRGCGLRELVSPMTRAAVAAGADGVVIEVHPDPRAAHRDGQPSLSPGEFSRLMGELRPFVEAAGRTL